MKNVPSDVVAPLTVDTTTPRRAIADERQRHREKRRAAWERAEAERERVEIGRELRAARLL